MSIVKVELDRESNPASNSDTGYRSGTSIRLTGHVPLVPDAQMDSWLLIRQRSSPHVDYLQSADNPAVGAYIIPRTRLDPSAPANVYHVVATPRPGEDFQVLDSMDIRVNEDEGTISADVRDVGWREKSRSLLELVQSR